MCHTLLPYPHINVMDFVFLVHSTTYLKVIPMTFTRPKLTVASTSHPPKTRYVTGLFGVQPNNVPRPVPFWRPKFTSTSTWWALVTHVSEALRLSEVKHPMMASCRHCMHASITHTTQPISSPVHHPHLGLHSWRHHT